MGSFGRPTVKKMHAAEKGPSPTSARKKGRFQMNHSQEGSFQNGATPLAKGRKPVKKGGEER